MLLYEYINTKEQLDEFVQELNRHSIRDKHLLFVHVLKPNIIDVAPKDFPRTKNITFQKWWFNIGEFQVFCTVKINKKLPIENPELKSGFYQDIYFHINPNDYSGISRDAS